VIRNALVPVPHVDTDVVGVHGPTSIKRRIRISPAIYYGARYGRRVTVDGDYYWHLPVDAAFDMSKQPAEFTAGQLSDDLHATSGEIVDPLTVWHELAHLIGLLRTLELRARL
jgi:hypothetical protein